MKVLDLTLMLHLNRSGGIRATEIPAISPKVRVKQTLDHLVAAGTASLVISADGHGEEKCLS